MKLEDYIVRKGWAQSNHRAKHRRNSLEEYARKSIKNQRPLDVSKPWICNVFLFMKASNKPCLVKEIARGAGTSVKTVYQVVAEMIRSGYNVKKTADGRFIRYQLVL